MESDKKQTPLTQLPQNSETDSDLVNKILNQLETSTDASPSFEINESIQQPTVPLISEKYVESTSHKEEDIMPSPQGIQKMVQSMDIPYIYKIIKMSVVYGLVFLAFVYFTDTFVKLFSKIPLITVTVGNELNLTGKLLQSVCFSLVYFFINIFVSNSKY